MSEDSLDNELGAVAFFIMVNGHNPEFMERMRQPHPDFPVSKKSGSMFEDKEND